MAQEKNADGSIRKAGQADLNPPTIYEQSFIDHAAPVFEGREKIQASTQEKMGDAYKTDISKYDYKAFGGGKFDKHDVQALRKAGYDDDAIKAYSTKLSREQINDGMTMNNQDFVNESFRMGNMAEGSKISDHDLKGYFGHDDVIYLKRQGFSDKEIAKHMYNSVHNDGIKHGKSEAKWMHKQGNLDYYHGAWDDASKRGQGWKDQQQGNAGGSDNSGINTGNIGNGNLQDSQNNNSGIIGDGNTQQNNNSGVIGSGTQQNNNNGIIGDGNTQEINPVQEMVTTNTNEIYNTQEVSNSGNATGGTLTNSGDITAGGDVTFDNSVNNENWFNQFGGDTRTFNYTVNGNQYQQAGNGNSSGGGGGGGAGYMNSYKDPALNATPVSAATMAGFYAPSDSHGASAGRIARNSLINQSNQAKYKGVGDSIANKYLKSARAGNRINTAALNANLNVSPLIDSAKSDLMTAMTFGDIWKFNPNDFTMPSSFTKPESPDFEGMFENISDKITGG